MQPGGEVLRHPPGAGSVRQPPEREDREVARRDDVRAVPRPPELDERRVLPGGRLGALDARVDREERGAGHAVLQAGPRRTPERAPSAWEPLVERADVSSEREDLRPREVEPRRPHVRPPWVRLSWFGGWLIGWWWECSQAFPPYGMELPGRPSHRPRGVPPTGDRVAPPFGSCGTCCATPGMAAHMMESARDVTEQRATNLRTVILVEGESDELAVEPVASRFGRDLNAEGLGSSP